MMSPPACDSDSCDLRPESEHMQIETIRSSHISDSQLDFSDDVSDDSSYIITGLDGLETISARIKNINGAHSGNFYGAITFGPCYEVPHTNCIYKREKDQAEFVQTGDVLLLTDSFVVSDVVEFDFMLMGEMGRQRPSFTIDFVPRGGLDFDELVYKDIDAEYCWIKMSYILLSRGTSAEVEVSLVDVGRKDQARLYGKLTARFPHLGYEVVLFQKEAGEHVEVRPGERLELSRSTVCVDCSVPLKIFAELYDCDECLPFDNEIVKGYVEFFVQETSKSYLFRTGVTRKFLVGECGSVRIMINWVDRSC